MIADNETNFVFFSAILPEKYPISMIRISEILNSYNVKYDYLRETKDIWCRDYMPVQISVDKFIQFKYEPSYLNNTEGDLQSKSNPKIVCNKNNIDPTFSDLNIDGGNVIKSDDKVFLTQITH